MKVLVVGGAGYIGSHLVRAMKASRDFEPVVLDNLCLGHKEAVREATLVQGDLNDRASLEAVFEKFDFGAVMHFASFIAVGESVSDPAKYYQNNVVGTFNLLEVMRKRGINYFIFSSTAAVYGIPKVVPIPEETELAPINPYGRTKLVIEQILEDFDRAYGLKSVRFRYFNAAGAAADGAIGEDHKPETHLIPVAIQALMGKREVLNIMGGDYPTPDGTCIRDYIHVEDLAEAHILGLKWLETNKKSEVFNLGTGSGYSVKQVVDTIEKVTGKKVPVIMAERRPGDPPELVAASDKAKQVLIWGPKLSDLATIVKTAWEWHRKHPEGFEKEKK